MNARVKLKGKAHIHLTHQSCGHYSLFKDEIIDKIYDNCVRNISEEKFLLQNGVPFHVLKDYMANKASDEVISKIQNLLNTYSLEQEVLSVNLMVLKFKHTGIKTSCFISSSKALV